METQKASYKSQLESLRASHQTQIENLEKEVDDNYNEGLKHFYRCIMAVLERQHPDLKMDELAASVTDYINEEAAKEDKEEIRPNATEKATSLPLLPPLMLSKQALSRAQLVRPLLLLYLTIQQELLFSQILYPRECTIIFFCKHCMPSFETVSHFH